MHAIYTAYYSHTLFQQNTWPWGGPGYVDWSQAKHTDRRWPIEEFQLFQPITNAIREHGARAEDLKGNIFKYWGDH